MNEENVRTILLEKSVFSSNDAEADVLRAKLKDDGLLLVNVMSSPGAGKTTTLINLINRLKNKFNIGVMEADIDSDVDAKKVAKETNVKSIQLHTGGMCHLDAFMTSQGLNAIDISDLDLVFLENVGNLVCPAEFDTGSHINMVILSIPEGDDKPLKYPLIFSKCDLVVINKIDTLDYFDFSMNKVIDNIKLRNKNSTIISISAKTGEGMEKLSEYFINKVLVNKEK